MFIADPSRKPTDIFLYTLQKGVIIFAGRTMTTTPDSFASVVIRAKSEDEARNVMNSDPAVKGGLFRAKLFPFQPMLIASQE